jgi:hypothetical protein
MFCAIVSAADRRRDARRTIGAAATVCRIVGGESVDQLDVLVRDVRQDGIGMRSPTRLARDGIYRLSIGAAMRSSGIGRRCCRTRRTRGGFRFSSFLDGGLAELFSQTEGKELGSLQIVGPRVGVGMFEKSLLHGDRDE